MAINFVITPALGSVVNTFLSAVTAFNSQDAVGLGNCLDDNVVLYRKRDGAVIAQKKINVLPKLQGLFTDNGSGPATFSPISGTPTPIPLPVRISGAAKWHDNDGSLQTIGSHTNLLLIPAIL